MNSEWPKLIDGYPTQFGLSFENEEYFTEENDHNPLVIPNCPHCIMGKTAGVSRGPNRSHAHSLCETCHGTGIATPPIPQLRFDCDSNEMDVACNKTGHVRCPQCVIGFKYYDKRAYSGKRHNCGQKLNIDRSAHEKP